MVTRLTGGHNQREVTMSFETAISEMASAINRLAAVLESAHSLSLKDNVVPLRPQKQAAPAQEEPAKAPPVAEAPLQEEPAKKRGRPRKAAPEPEPEPVDETEEQQETAQGPAFLLPEPQVITREQIRKVLRVAGSEPNGRALVIETLHRFGVKHLDALDEESFVPFLSEISEFAPAAVELLEQANG